jgi:hypothetical protein
MPDQLRLAVVPATALRVGDRIEVRFAVYGALMCPIIQAPKARKNLLDIGIRIGDDGPAYWTLVDPESKHTVLR